MVRVTLAVPDRGRIPSGVYEFDVAPTKGQLVVLRAGDEAIWFEVEDVWHTQRNADEDVAYVAMLIRRNPPPKWARIDDYDPPKITDGTT